MYRNFDDITGLDFAGEAFSSTCEEGTKVRLGILHVSLYPVLSAFGQNPALLYQPKHGRSDPTDSDTVPHLIVSHVILASSFISISLNPD